MTEWIKDFSMQDIVKHGGALIGDKQERENTVEYIIGSLDTIDGPLVVLDADGSLFGKFGGRGILVDLESSNSALPDCLAPILAHRKYGRTPKLCAKLIGDILIREKQDRSSNDMFWTQSGRQTLHEYIEYGLLLAYHDKCNGAGTGNVMLDAARTHGYLSKLMQDFVAKGADAVDRWKSSDEWATPTLRRRTPALLSERDKALQAELARLYGQGAMPFVDTLVSYAKSGSTTTPNNVLKTAMSMGQRILDFNERLSEDCRFYETLPTLELGAFVRDNGIMYIVAGRDKDVSALQNLLVLLGAAAAADTAGIQITCLIPDIAASDIFEGLCAINSLFPRALRTIIGCGDFLRAARRTDLQVLAYFDRLTDLASQHVIWHKSNDVFLKQIFSERTSGQDLMYGIGDLGGNHLIAVEEGGEVEYAYMQDASEIEHIPGVREERTEDSCESTPLWFFVEALAFEDNACTGFDFDEDEDEDILTQHSNSPVA